MSTMNDYQDIIDNLPKPTTDLEEQYLYSIVMAMAGKDYQPFSKPFWRKEQYLKAWWEITKLKVAEGNIPNDNSVSTEKIVDGAVTLIKLSKEVVDKLLADDKIETSMIKDLAITTEKIVNNAISAEKVSDDAIILSKLSKEVTNLLLTANHVGIIQQPQINQITESGDMLTLDVIKNKVNEIIQLLNNAEVTK